MHRMCAVHCCFSVLLVTGKRFMLLFEVRYGFSSHFSSADQLAI